MTESVRIRDLSLPELEAFVVERGDKPFRAKQIYQWLWHKGASSYEEMTNIARDFRDRLKNETLLDISERIEAKPSPSGTTKLLTRYLDGQHVETVLIPEENRVTVCVSSQVGCALNCDFCATGKMGLKRNLTSGEILDQLRYVREISDRPITNIVFMGMGEPFHNYDQVLKAAAVMHAELGFGHGARKITISTSGLVPQIQRFADEGHRFKLAVSLNATTDAVRTAIMPVNKRWPIQELVQACQTYTEKSRNMMTFEYVLLDGLNDSLADARRLIQIGRQVFCKVNVIPYNEIGGTYRRPPDKRIEAFLAELSRAPFPLTVRWSAGQDIDAACGQLSTARLELEESS